MVARRRKWAVVERLHVAEARGKIKAEIVHNIRDGRGGGDPKNVVLVNCGFDPSLAGKNLAELTRARGADVKNENAAETAMGLQEKGGCSAVYHAIDETDIERIMRSPYTMIASDGEIPVFGKQAAHPRSYGTFARVLGVYVRERKVLTLQDAIRRMSSMPAERLKFGDRGLLRPGMKADIAVFDPAAVRDTATFQNPHQYAVGFSQVIVNGEVVYENGQMTDARPGRVLYGPGRR